VAVTNALRLLKLDERVQQMLIDNKLSSGHARALLSIEDADVQYDAACKVSDKGLSVRDTEKLVKQMLKTKRVKETAVTEENSFIYRDLEERLKNIMGTKVSINRKQKGRGKIEIEYYSDDDLERIMDLFNSLL
jgi:ParB family chromosome partitioning protein